MTRPGFSMRVSRWVVLGVLPAAACAMDVGDASDGDLTEEQNKVKPPSSGEDLGCLSTIDNVLNLRNGTLRNASTTVFTFDVCTIPADRQRLLAYVTTYVNKHPSLTLTDPGGEVHAITGDNIEPQKHSLFVNLPAELGTYAAEIDNDAGSYTFFFGALMTSQTGFGAP